MPKKKNKYKLGLFSLFPEPEDPEEHNHCHCEGNV